MTSSEQKSLRGKTVKLSETAIDKMRAAAGVGEAEQQLSLLFYHRDGTTAAQLDEGQTLVIGRDEPAELIIPDPSLSRQHATLELVNGELWVEDLDSTNGTWVDGLLVERSKVTQGAKLGLGAVTVAASTDVAAGLDLDSHDRFQRALEVETERSRIFARKHALVVIHDVSGRYGHASQWLPAVRDQLRSFDIMGLYSADTLEVLMPEQNIEAASLVATSIAQAQPGLRCGVGLFPHHAASADELLDVTRAALHLASDDDPLSMATKIAGAETSGIGEKSGLVATSKEMVRAFTTARRFADKAMPVLILGETGTGKEVVARLIHESGNRKAKTMITVNCGAIPGQLVESTLFGHEKGAFTGATSRSEGVFESADGGTVFLDEIGEMPLQAQAALLRVLETKRITRVGATKEIEVDVRIIAATHRNLEEMSDKGSFRRDLYYRLDAMAIHIPPLRERRADIEPLSHKFIGEANETNGCAVKGLADEASAVLQKYLWPGNVRELRNTIERAVVIAQGEHITTDDLPERLRRLARRVVVRPVEESDAGEELICPINLKAEVQQYEAQVIVKALNSVDWDRKLAARNLGLPVRTLGHKIQVYGIKRGDS